MYSVNKKLYNWPPTVSPCESGRCSYKGQNCPCGPNCNCNSHVSGESCGCGPNCNCDSHVSGESCGCGPQYPNNRPLCPYKGGNCPCSKNCFEGTGNCPRRMVYDDLMVASPLNTSSSPNLYVPNECVYQGPTPKNNPRFGFRKPIPLPYPNYTPYGDQRSSFDNSPGCYAFKNRGPF